MVTLVLFRHVCTKYTTIVLQGSASNSFVKHAVTPSRPGVHCGVTRYMENKNVKLPVIKMIICNREYSKRWVSRLGKRKM